MSYSKKVILFLVLCVVVTLLVRREETKGTFAKLNREYVNWLIGTKKETTQPISVTLLRIEDSEDSIFQEWPPSPIDYAIILSQLKQYNPKLVAVESSMSWSNADEGLLETLRSASLKYDTGQLLIGVVVQMDRSADNPQQNIISMLTPIPNVIGNTNKIPEFTNIDPLPDRRLTSIGVPIGFTAIDLAEQNQDDRSLSVPLLARIGKHVVPSFVLKAIMLNLDANPEDLKITLGEKIEFKEGTVIPIDFKGSLEVFPGLRQKLPKENVTVLVYDPINKSNEPRNKLEKKQITALSNRVIVLGIDTASSQTIPFSFGQSISQSELLALAIATIQRGLYLKSLSSQIEWTLWLGIIIFGLFLMRQHRRRAIGMILLFALLYFTGSMIVFQSNSHWVEPVIPLTLMACLFITSLTLCQKKFRDSESSEEE